MAVVREVTLHIGQAKAASTALQRGLTAQRDRLREAGIEYPLRPGSVYHRSEVADLQLSWVRPVTGNERGYARIQQRAVPGSWNALVERVRAAPDRAIVSNEALCGFTPAAARAVLADLTNGHPESGRIVLVVRPLGSLLASVYNQLARDTVAPTLGIWTRTYLASYDRGLPQGHFAWLWADEVVRAWSGHGAELVLVPYSTGEQFEQQLLSAMSLSTVMPRPFLPRANDSMGAAAIAAWQRFLRSGNDGLDPRVRELLSRWREAEGDRLSPQYSGRLALMPDVVQLIDAAYPQPGQPTAESDRSWAREQLARRLASPEPITAGQVDPDLVDELFASVQRLAADLGDGRGDSPEPRTPRSYADLDDSSDSDP